MNWYLKCLKNYTVFEGRARRKEFWMFQLVSSIIFLVLYFAGYALHKIIGIGVDSLIPFIVYGLYIIPPTMAVAVRRLHDVNKSGWPLFIFYLSVAVYVCLFWEASGHRYWGPLTREDVELILLVIPSVPFIWLLILFCKDSYPTENEYGPNPKTLES